MKTIDFREIQAAAQLRKTESQRLLYRIRLDFRFQERVCIRDIVVNARTTLDDLHAIIQACGRWHDYHLYSFEFVYQGHVTVAERPSEDAESDYRAKYDISSVSSVTRIDPATITLEEAVQEFPCMVYYYDYGDGWEICITLLSVVHGQPKRPAPYCVFGKGDWPPEDVGGEAGFIRFLKVVNDPASEDHDWLVQWGEDQGFEKYSLARCNANLSHWMD